MYVSESNRVKEPEDLLVAKSKAIWSLGHDLKNHDTIRWRDFKKAYLIMHIWTVSKKFNYTSRDREADARRQAA